MKDKRITIVVGHYGSGKTNIAVNLAYNCKAKHENTAIADLDIVNPYFRTKDSEDLFRSAGIRLICSDYANSNLDIPALPQDIYSITDDRSLHCILDVGGDERGALALGRIAPAIRDENDYEMLYVVNRYRPLTRDAASTVEVLREIEAACGLCATAIVNNSNLGCETTISDIIGSQKYSEEISNITGLPVKYTTVHSPLYEDLKDKITNLYPIFLQRKLFKEDLQ